MRNAISSEVEESERLTLRKLNRMKTSELRSEYKIADLSFPGTKSSLVEYDVEPGLVWEIQGLSSGMSSGLVREVLEQVGFSVSSVRGGSLSGFCIAIMENLILPKKPEQNHEPEEPVTMIGSFSLPFSMRQLVGTEELHFYQHEEFRSSRTPAEYHRDLLLALTQIVVQNNQRMQALKDGAKRSICDNCGDEFSSRSALFKHIKSSHDLSGCIDPTAVSRTLHESHTSSKFSSLKNLQFYIEVI